MTQVVSKKVAVAGVSDVAETSAPGSNAVEVGTIHEFVCNSPNQLLRFKDGSTFAWPNPRTSLVTADPILAAKLISEGERFGVLQR